MPADITAIAAGWHSLVVARQAPSATTLTVSPGEQEHGGPATLTVHVTCEAGTPAGTVDFFVGGVSVGVADLAGGNAELTVTTLAEGTRTITAAYSGCADCQPSTSGPEIVTITARPPVPAPPSVPARPAIPRPPRVAVTG